MTARCLGLKSLSMACWHSKVSSYLSRYLGSYHYNYKLGPFRLSQPPFSQFPFLTRT